MVITWLKLPNSKQAELGKAEEDMFQECNFLVFQNPVLSWTKIIEAGLRGTASPFERLILKLKQLDFKTT